MNSRLDIELYVVGSTKHDFINFISDSFKTNFFESLSWGHFRRYQLILSNGSNWLNIFFHIINNEDNLDLIINSKKQIEKKQLILLLYNIQDQKTIKEVEDLIESYNYKKHNLYEGILNENTIKSNINKIKTSIKQSQFTDESNAYSNNNELVKYLEENISDKLNNSLGHLDNKTNSCDKLNLLKAIGFASTFNIKRSKLSYNKKIELNNLNIIEQEMFYYDQFKQESQPINFNSLINELLNDYFSKFKINEETSVKFIDIVIKSNEFINKQIKVENKVDNNIYFKKYFHIFLLIILSYLVYKYSYKNTKYS